MEVPMASLRTTFGTAALLAVATAFVSPGVGRAAGPFDGNWVLNAAGSGGRAAGGGDEQACSDFRLPMKISDNQISGNYSRSPSTPSEIVPSPTGSPMKGAVQPDGSFSVQWESFNITGKITGNALVANWTGQCGPRSAQGTRVQ
jgi:hypothetical protein